MERRLPLTLPKKDRYARISLIGGLAGNPTKDGMQTNFCKENYLKMNKIVYRFEHSTNKDLGLWYMRDGSDSGFVHKLGLSSKEMPMGRDDSHYIAPSGHKYHCSAPDKETLLHWFSQRDYPILRDNGFVLIEYEVSEYLEDGPQTLFTKEGVVSEKVIPYNKW